MPLTIANLKQLVQGVIAPGDDALFLNLLQQADDRLLESGKWPWTRGRTTLTAEEIAGVVRITLPPKYRAVVAVRVGDVAVDIEDEAFEFSPDGVGDVKSGEGDLKLIDEGWQDVTDGNTVETRRVYKVVGAKAGDVLTVLAHYAPAILCDPDLLEGSDDPPPGSTDIPYCPSLGPLKNMMMSIRAEDNSDHGNSIQHDKKAAFLLNNKGSADRGSAKATVMFRPQGQGVHRIRTFL